jgi:hypothetical protein
LLRPWAGRLDSLESGDQHVEDFEAYRRHELAFASPALADDLIGVGGTAIYPSFPKWASEYGPKNGMKVNYQVLGWGAGIEQETTKISERQSGETAVVGHISDSLGALRRLKAAGEDARLRK